ncbi:OmpA family protein [Magnetovirga frankeli]|uniref:OmpA family protein n=1 Tax=Magnetovirga frankeli TaxID=947516 RepID=UPI003D345AEE
MSALSQASPADLEQDPELGHDPWMNLQPEASGSDSWMLSYVDVLTLLLVLMVVLLMLQRAGNPDSPLDLPAAPSPLTQQAAAPLQAEPQLEQPKAASSGVSDPLILATDEAEADWPLLTESLPFAEQPLAEPLLTESPAELAEPQTREPGERQADPAQGQISRPSTAAEAKADRMLAVRPAMQQPPGVDLAPLIEALRWKGLGKGVTLSTNATQVRLETRDNILFADASAELTDSGADLLLELTSLLLRYPGIISVEGHADSRPITSTAFPSNWELSSARAASVVRYLVGQGIDAERLRAIGYGDTRPRADNASSEGRAANRRVSLVLEPRPESRL